MCHRCCDFHNPKAFFLYPQRDENLICSNGQPSLCRSEGWSACGISCGIGAYPVKLLFNHQRNKSSRILFHANSRRPFDPAFASGAIVVVDEEVEIEPLRQGHIAGKGAR